MGLFGGLFNIRKLFGGTFYSSASSNYLLGSKTPIWIDTNNLGSIYETIPEVRLVIDNKATLFSNMVIKCVDADGEEVEHQALELLTNPNPLQTQNEFLSQYMVNKSIYGNSFFNKLKATSTSFPSTMYVLPSEFISIVPTGKMFQQSFIEDIIKSYDLEIQGQTDSYPPEEILHKNDIATDDYLASESRLLPLKMPISNIEGAYKSRNILINEKGAIGILSNNNKDSDGGLPLNPEEKEQIQQDYQSKYGIGGGQNRVIISNASLNWQPMASGIKDLMLFEEIQEDFNRIVDAYGLNMNIFSNTKGSTFENQKQGLKSTYQNTIIPEANDLMQGLTTFLGLDLEGLELIADYSHLAVLQDDELKREQSEMFKVNRLKTLYDTNVITINDIREEIGEEPLPELDVAPVVVSEDDALSEGGAEVQDANALAQAGLRGSVGGVQGILQIQDSFSRGVTSEASALSILMTIYGFDNDTARSILGV